MSSSINQIWDSSPSFKELVRFWPFIQNPLLCPISRMARLVRFSKSAEIRSTASSEILAIFPPGPVRLFFLFPPLGTLQIVLDCPLPGSLLIATASCLFFSTWDVGAFSVVRTRWINFDRIVFLSRSVFEFFSVEFKNIILPSSPYT